MSRLPWLPTQSYVPMFVVSVNPIELLPAYSIYSLGMNFKEYHVTIAYQSCIGSQFLSRPTYGADPNAPHRNGVKLPTITPSQFDFGRFAALDRSFSVASTWQPYTLLSLLSLCARGTFPIQQSTLTSSITVVIAGPTPRSQSSSRAHLRAHNTRLHIVDALC